MPEAAAAETPAAGASPVAGSTPAPAEAPKIIPEVFDKGDAPEPKPDAKAAPEAKADDTPKPWYERLAKGKYKTEEEAEKGIGELYGMATKNAAALKAAEDRWKGVETWFGAPVAEDGKTPAEYDIKLPEGATLDPAARKGWEAYCRENNLSNAKAQEVFDKVVLPLEAGRELGRREYERERTVDALGGGDEAVATAQASAAFQWAAQALATDDAAMEDLRECGGVGAAINTIARLHAKYAGISMGRGDGGGPLITQAEYEAILKDPRGLSTPENVAKVDAYLNRPRA